MRTNTNGNAIVSLLTWIVVKPTVLAGLYSLIRWVTLETGYTQELIPSLAGSFARFAGITYAQSIIAVLALLAFSGLQLASALWGAVTAAARS